MRFGRIGYVSKGPVVAAGQPAEVAEFLIEMVRRVASRFRLSAVIVQPPDRAMAWAGLLARQDFLPNRLVRVIDASAWADLGGTSDDLLRRLNQTTRRNVRRAQEAGLTIREGTRADVATFFNLMTITCRRQASQPNPRTIREMEALWDALQTPKRVRLSFACYQNRDVAGILTIVFGSTATLWKKGWSEEEIGVNPNVFVTFEAMQWAQARGFKCADFVGFDRRMAETMSVAGSGLPSGLDSTRHLFSYRLGGRPQLLPKSLVFVPSGWLRIAYRIFCKVARRDWS